MLYLITSSKPSLLQRALQPELGKAPDLEVKALRPDEVSLDLFSDGDTVLALGVPSLKRLQSLGVFQKNRTIGSLRQSVHLSEGIPYFVSYDPYVGEVDHVSKINMVLDIRLAVRYAITGSVMPKIGKYEWVDDYQHLVDMAEASDKPIPMAIDLETLGLDEYDPEGFIVSISVTAKTGHAHLIRFKSRLDYPDNKLHAQLDYLLTSDNVKVRGANFKYDQRWMRRHWGLVCTNFSMDTTLVGSLLDENRSNSLNTHAKLYSTMGGYDDPFNQKYDKGRMDLVPDDDLLVYAGGDTDATLRVSNEMVKEIGADRRLSRFYVELLHPSVQCFERMESEGILLDVPYYEALKGDLEKDIAKTEQAIIDMLPGRLKNKHKDNLSVRAAIIKDFMFSPLGLNLSPLMVTEKSGEPSTAKNHLQMFGDHPEAAPFIELLNDYNGATKTLSTYVIGFLKHVRSDGRLHPSYMLFRGDYGGSDSGTVTGRLSAKDPAVQCCVGETEVVTNKGLRRIDWLVEREGAGLKVLTHTGKWRDIIGVYRNGIQPVYDVLLTSGHVVRCTGNHPFYTDNGWVRADALAKGDTCYVTRTPHEGIHQSDLLQLGSHEEPMPVGVQQGLATLRGEGHQSLPEVDDVSEFSGGHGGETGKGVVHREVECGRGLRTGELLLGQPEGASEKQTEHKDADPQWEDPDHGAMGGGIRDKQGAVEIPSGCYRPSDGGSLDEHENIERRIFKPEEIVSVTLVGPRETFDLTIDRSHSFIANGVVVHNTIPKHSKWAEALRRGYPAPPGYVFFEVDFSQGELRVTACVANEPAMIKAYNQGIDMHLLTGCDLTDTDFEWAQKIKKLGDKAPPEHKKLVKMIRQNGKAGNFGLIYGMSAGGFQIYARDSYGVHMTLTESEVKRDAFFNRFQTLPNWHDRVRREAAVHQMMRSPLGRIRHLPNIKSPDSFYRSQAERQAINSPVQATLSDLTQYSMVEFCRQYPDVVWKDLKFCMMTHDSLGGYVREDKADILIPKLVEVMSNLPLAERFGWKPQVQFTADAELGPTLGDLVEV